MLDATTVMNQAGMTAAGWMRSAKEFVEMNFSKYPKDLQVQLIAAYVTAAAGDEIAMHIRAVAEELLSRRLDTEEDSDDKLL